MKIFVTGGTGFVGRTLIRHLVTKGHEMIILSRHTSKTPAIPEKVSYIKGDPTLEGPWQNEVSHCDAIINLAGASIFCRWTKSKKKQIMDSRILTTRNIVKALAPRKGKKTLFLSTSAVGYYGFREDEELDENSPIGEGFLSSVTRDWEVAAMQAAESDAQVTLLRFGVVLGRDGGALRQLVPLFKKYLGSPLGNGKQWFSWIHELDLAHIYSFVLDHRGISGPINCTAPQPVRNRDMTKILGEALGKPTFMPAIPAFVIRILMGEFGTTLLKGQKVLPKKLLESGFNFRFPELGVALKDLLSPL